MNAKLIEQLQAGVCLHTKRWSGDVHGGMEFGPLDVTATNELMARAADEIERLRAEIEYAIATGKRVQYLEQLDWSCRDRPE